MIRLLDFIAHLPGIRWLLARSASRRQEALSIGHYRHWKPTKFDASGAVITLDMLHKIDENLRKVKPVHRSSFDYEAEALQRGKDLTP